MRDQPEAAWPLPKLSTPEELLHRAYEILGRIDRYRETTRLVSEGRTGRQTTDYLSVDSGDRTVLRRQFAEVA